MNTNPTPVHIVVWDWHNVFDRPNLAQCKINLAFGLSTSQKNLDGIFERCGVGKYLTGLIPSDLFWDRIHEFFPRFGTLIEDERVSFLEPHIDIELVKLARIIHELYPCALLSNASDDKAKIIREKCKDGELELLFDFIAFSCDKRMAKQSIEFYKEFEAETKIEPKYCLIIDDSVSNLLVARKLGYQTFHYKDTKHFKKNIGERLPKLLAHNSV